MELPVEIGRLERLELLEVSNCWSLKRIVPGVISKLVQLEELMIVESFDGWERKSNGEQRDNAAFCELEHLKNLTSLDIEFEDANLAAEEICFSTKIVKYQMKIVKKYRTIFLDRPIMLFIKHERAMDLVLRKDITLAKWIHVFVRSSHSLDAKGDGSNKLDLAQAQCLKRLICHDCSTMNKLVNTTSSMNQSFGVFPFLESLELSELPNLEEICQLPKSSHSFRNLKKLEVNYCPKLRKLFPLAIAKDGLFLLEKLEIEKCEMMEEVFANEENEKDVDQCHMITFPKLMSLKLKFLPRLTSFCKGSESIEFPLLKYITIQKCGKLKSLISGSCNNLNLKGHDADSLHLFCNDKASFGSLKKIDIQEYRNISKIWCRQIPLCFFTQLEDLRIKYFNGIRSLFSTSIAKNLGNLKLLVVVGRNCEVMKEVISNEENEKDIGEQCHRITFPQLKSLELYDLQRLTSFCKGSESIEFPMLEEITIYNCEKLTSIISSTCDNLNLEDHDHDSVHLFCNQKVSFGCLKEIHICGYDISNMWCHQIPVGFFNQLVILRIWSCNVIRSLFSSSIEGNLVNLERLDIQHCKEMVEVIEYDEEMLAADRNPRILFPSLKELILYELPKLQSFCNWRCDLKMPSLENVYINKCPLLEMESVIFGNLKEIDITDCDGISSLFSSSIAKKLVNLERLKIWCCNEMVKVIEDIDEEMLAANQNPHLLFPNLKKLELKMLPKLQRFCSWRCDVMLLSLEIIRIKKCPLLEFFTMESVILGNLKEITIMDCDGISSLFSSSIAKKLINLKKLKISSCNEMVKVIEDIDEEMLAADQNLHRLFPSLEDLVLENLPKLQSFCNWRCDLKIPSLEDVKILQCPLLEIFTMGSVSTPNLKFLEIDSSDKDVGDLNREIQLDFETNQHQPISNPEETTSSDEEESETDQAESEIKKTEMEEETLISYDKQAGAEEDYQKSEIQEAEQINEVSTSAEVKVVEADHEKSEIEEEEINEEATSERTTGKAK